MFIPHRKATNGVCAVSTTACRAPIIHSLTPHVTLKDCLRESKVFPIYKQFKAKACKDRCRATGRGPYLFGFWPPPPPETEEIKAANWKVIRSKHGIHVLHLNQKENTELQSVKLKIKGSCWHSCFDPTQTSSNTESKTFHFFTYRSRLFI